MPITRSLRWSLLSALTGALAVGAGTALWLLFELHRPLQIDDTPQILEVERGASVHRLAHELEERGWIGRAGQWALRGYGRLFGSAAALKAGEYAVHEGMSSRQLIDRIAAGRVIQHRLTIVEGWTYRQLIQALEAHDAIETTLGDESGESVLATLGVDAEALGAETSHPEGLFKPDTYRFPRGTTDQALLRAAHRQLREHLAKTWADRQSELPLETPYEALILASIIEKETGRDDERRRVAGVFIRRLEQGMRLQTDPTVVYGLGEDFDGRLRRADLRRDTPYNTYTRHGLPPTPIALPGRRSLEAAVDPKPGTALYFVSRGDGSHHFSDTLEEHNRAVDYYIRGEGEPPESVTRSGDDTGDEEER